MHEMALASDVADTVVAAAQNAGAHEVRCIYLTIGSGRDIVEDLFGGLLTHLMKGTIAEQAELVIDRVPLMVKCKDCGWIYNIDVFDSKTWLCPHCGKKDYSLYAGMEFSIERIDVA